LYCYKKSCTVLHDAVIMSTKIYEGELKSKGKIHLTDLIEVTVSNFTYIFLHSLLATQCVCYIVQLVSVFLKRRSFSAALVVLCARCWWPTRTTFISNTCSNRFKPFHPLINLSLIHGALSILSQHTTVNFRRFHSFCPKKTALRHVVLRWCNLAKERLCFRPRCCHSTEGGAVYCTWLNSSTSIVNTAQCGRSTLFRLPCNLKIAFIFWFTLVLA